MDLDDLRDVQRRERATDSLQDLPDAFYEEVSAYVAERKQERDRAADAADDPFASPEVSRLTDEINTAERVAEAIYERRVGKVVKRATFAAADVSADDAGLTAEERALYDDLVDRIEANKSRVLDVIAGDVSSAESSGADGSEAGSDATADSATGSDAATDAATESRAGPETARESRPSGEAAGPSVDEEPTASRDDEESVSAAAAMGGDEDHEPTRDVTDAADDTADAADDTADADAGVDDRSTVRITNDVGEIYGVDERVYTLEADDVVTLPETNADPLVERGAAEKLE